MIVGVGAVGVAGLRSRSKVRLCNTRKRWRRTKLLPERTSAQASTQNTLSWHRPHMKISHSMGWTMDEEHARCCYPVS